jgi:hypothetical protein
MKDTIDYQHHRIVALQKRVSELELMLLECNKQILYG